MPDVDPCDVGDRVERSWGAVERDTGLAGTPGAGRDGEEGNEGNMPSPAGPNE